MMGENRAIKHLTVSLFRRNFISLCFEVTLEALRQERARQLAAKLMRCAMRLIASIFR